MSGDFGVGLLFLGLSHYVASPKEIGNGGILEVYIYNPYHPHMFGLYEKDCDILLINYSIFHLQWFEGSVKVLKWNKNTDIPNSKVGGDLVRRKLPLEAVFFLVIHWKLNLRCWNNVTIPMCEIVLKKLWPWNWSFNSSGKSQDHWSQASAVEECTRKLKTGYPQVWWLIVYHHYPYQKLIIF